MEMILSLTRARVEELRKIIRESAERERASSFVIEGPHLVERAFESAAERIQEVIFTESALEEFSDIRRLTEEKNIPCYKATAKFAERISDTKTPQGIFAVMELPRNDFEIPTSG